MAELSDFLSGLGSATTRFVAGLPRVATGAVGGVGGFVDGLGNWIGTPGNVEKIGEIVDVIGKGYGVYQSYEQQKAALKAAQKYGGQVVVPYPAGVAGGPADSAGPAGAFSTVVDIAMPGQGGPGIGKEQTETYIMYAAGAALAYILFFRKAA